LCFLVQATPEKRKYQFWTTDLAEKEQEETYEDWFARANETPGSWWNHWHDWALSLDSDTKPAPQPAQNHDILAQAPGTYVLEVT